MFLNFILILATELDEDACINDVTQPSMSILSFGCYKDASRCNVLSLDLEVWCSHVSYIIVTLILCSLKELTAKNRWKYTIAVAIASCGLRVVSNVSLCHYRQTYKASRHPTTWMNEQPSLRYQHSSLADMRCFAMEGKSWASSGANSHWNNFRMQTTRPQFALLTWFIVKILYKWKGRSAAIEKLVGHWKLLHTREVCYHADTNC